MTSTKIAANMPLTQEKRLDGNFSNNNDHSYLHKKFKKMASTITVLPTNPAKSGQARHIEPDIVETVTCKTSISNGSIAAAHPEIEKIKEISNFQNTGKNVQINFNEENVRLDNVNNVVQVSGQTSFTYEFFNKTENLENDFIKDAYNGGVGGRYICPYCKLSCAKPSVLQKHIRAHTNERPYPCEPCGFAFKTKSNLYKHRRSRTHALRLQGADTSVSLNDEDLSGGSESDTSIAPTSTSEAGSDTSHIRFDTLENNTFSPNASPEFMNDSNMLPSGINMTSDTKTKTIYKPKFRGAFYQDIDDKNKLKKSISPNANFLTEHISKIISDNEAIVDVIETPLQKKYGKIKQIAESKQLTNDTGEIKVEQSPLNLTKSNNNNDNSFRKRSHSETFSQNDQNKHPLNPEGSIIKDLLLKTKMNGLPSLTTESIDGPLFICPLCQISYRSADNLETHRVYYCKGNISTSVQSICKEPKNSRTENLFVRSNSITVRLPETQPSSLLKVPITTKSPPKLKPDNLVIIKPEADVIAPLPSPGPLLGNTRLIDSRAPSDYGRKHENVRVRPITSPKRRVESRSDTYSPRLLDNMSPNEFYHQNKMRCAETNLGTLRSIEELSPHMRHNSTSLQMFGGEVKIVDHSGSTTTLRIEPNKNQLSPILIQQNLSPSNLTTDAEPSNVVVRSGLHSGGTMVHNPPTPKEIVGTTKPQTPRITISTGTGIHFQFPPLSNITAYNPLTLPPLSPSSTPNGATTILHGGKLIPHVPGIPGPNTPGAYTANSFLHKRNLLDERNYGNLVSIHIHNSKTSMKHETHQFRNSSPNLRPIHTDSERYSHSHDNLNTDLPAHFISNNVPVIKVEDKSSPMSKTFSPNIVKPMVKQDIAFKRNIDGSPKLPILKENSNSYTVIKNKHKDNITGKNIEIKSEKELRSFNFETIITKTEIYNNSQIQSSPEVQKNTNAQDTPSVSVHNERSETSYFQKNVSTKNCTEESKPNFLRPSTLPLKPGTFTPKRHHGITPNANTMPLVSPETPRPAKAYGQLYLNGNAYTYLGLKCSTKVFYCTINRPQPTYVPNQHFLSMYSNWQLLSELTPDPLGLSASSAMSLYDSRHRPQSVSVSVIKQDLLLTHSSQWNKITINGQLSQLTDEKKSEERNFSENTTAPKKELAGGFESNEEYTYVRGRGRGRYVCSECGIRCKKPSMLKKHIRTHTDVRPYTCIHCAFSFKTKGNLTKHMKSKAHYKKCCELGINPNEGNDAESGEMAQCSGETDDDTESDGDEGNEGETESSDTETCKSRLPEHEAAHCLLSLGCSRPITSSNPGLITSARPTTYPYTPTGLESPTSDNNYTDKSAVDNIVVHSKKDADEPMDLSKTDTKDMTPNITEIPTARESSVLASLASNTAKLPQHQSQWSNGEHMLHTYLTERALLDSKIKQSQLTGHLNKIRKIEIEKAGYNKSYSIGDNNKNVILTSSITTPISSSEIKVNDLKNTKSDIHTPTSTLSSNEEYSSKLKDSSVVNATTNELKKVQNNAENVKQVVSDYLKHARINLVKTNEEKPASVSDSLDVENNSISMKTEENPKIDDYITESESKLPSLEHDPIARKVVIGAGGVAFKVSKGKDFDNSSYSPGRLMEDGRRVCDFCNKTFTKPSQLRLHLNIHYMERPFRCSVCAVSFRTRGHLQKHERSGSHHNKVSMTSTFGAATSFNPRPFRCSDCNIAFRIHGHLAKHLRSKMHVMRLECLYKLPFGTFTEIERAGVSLTDIDTTDCASSLASLQSLARKLHEKDPSKLEYREPSDEPVLSLPANRDSEEEEDSTFGESVCDSEKDNELQSYNNSDGQDKETRVNDSATDI